jgi:2-polyprenyl-3-methyl-5-hydroxy-6-metoxy-1,4-benzoquinol methylase
MECGLVALESHDHIAPGHYEGSGMHDGSPVSMESWLRDTEQDDQRRLEMLKALLVSRRVLDVGCGAAGFLRKAQSLAREVVGVEPEARVREFYGDSLTLYRDIESVLEGEYDLVTAFHVVEHLPDPRSALAAFRKLLAGGGRVVIEVPSSEDALLTLYDCDAFQRFTYWSQHLYLFNAETLRRLAVQAGLQIVSIEQFQRYPLSNHLHWLSQHRPGGHAIWSFLNSPSLREAYAAALAAIGKCDTLIAHLEPSRG